MKAKSTIFHGLQNGDTFDEDSSLRDVKETSFIDLMGNINGNNNNNNNITISNNVSNHIVGRDSNFF